MSSRLTWFNTLSTTDAQRLLTACAAVPRWGQDIVAGRPYATVEEVLTAARSAADPWQPAEIDTALAQHPRIGERPKGTSAEAAHSRSEQSGIDTGDGALAEQLHQANEAYEHKFGHVFLICASGRSATEILTALQERMGNDADTERQVAAEQLRQIAVLRLRKELR